MSKPNDFENDLLLLIFNKTAISNLARDSATGVTDLYVSLHVGDPGEGGDQSTNEATYTGYARVAVPRDSSGWTVTGNSVVPANPIIFPVGSGGSGVVTHFGIGLTSGAAGKLLYVGTVTPNLATGNLITPRLTVATQINED